MNSERQRHQEVHLELKGDKGTRRQEGKAVTALFLLLALVLILGGCRPGEARTTTEKSTTTGSTENSASENSEAENSEAATPASENNEGVTPARQETSRSVRVVVANEGTLTAQKSATVTITPKQESSVAAGATGRVETILKREGSSVEAGEVVIRIDNDNAALQVQNAEFVLNSAKINLEKARRATTEGGGQIEISLRSAQTNYDVLKKQYDESLELFNVGGVSQNQLDQLSAQLTQAESTVVQLQNSLAQNQRAGGEDLSLLELQVSQADTALQQARDALGETEISAPFAGEVSEIFTEEGEFLAAGSPAFRLVSTDQQLGTFAVPPSDARRLLAQKDVFIRYQGLDYAATIVRSNTAPNNQRLIDMTVELYPSDSPIASGSVAQLNYTLEESKGVLIPAGAVTAESGQNFVFVVADGKATRQAIQVVDEISGQAAVSGLEPGAQVVFPLPNDLREGAPVRVLE
ncbi:MAG: efflux RND transporter periplasmic adaptor subunit [Trueperaceae bacterium]